MMMLMTPVSSYIVFVFFFLIFTISLFLSPFDHSIFLERYIILILKNESIKINLLCIYTFVYLLEPNLNNNCFIFIFVISSVSFFMKHVIELLAEPFKAILNSTKMIVQFVNSHLDCIK